LQTALRKDSIIAREWLAHLNSDDKNDIRREVPITVDECKECDIHANKVGLKEENIII
jgi:hypothetical protein